jgi:uncharacterized protein YbjT (DUF2867 family)
MERVLVAGATGYLGRIVLQAFKKKGFRVRALARNESRLVELKNCVDEKIIGEITNANSLKGICDDVDTVFSSIGITKQKDGLTYMDVDYQGNLNLLNEAVKSGARKFIYVSVLNGNQLRKLKICEAKERFVEKIKKSGLDYCVIHPNGFFSDMTEFYDMSKKGRIYLFGNGNQIANPIHGEDLAKVCVSAIESNDHEIEVGGPETLTQNEIARLAFNAVGKKPKIVHIPEWVRQTILRISKLFMNSQDFGPVEFFMNVMAMEMIAPEYGKHTLREFFDGLKDNQLHTVH